jgi:hypothetical protein
MDIYDDADWTEMDIADLKAAIQSGPLNSRRLHNSSAAPTALTMSRGNAQSWD